MRFHFVLMATAIVTSACGRKAAPGGATAFAARDSLRGSDTHPDWSPDGRRIAYISNREGVRVGREINFEVYQADADGAHEERRTTNDAFEVDVAWSPDGTRLAFKSYRDGNDEIYLMNADGSDQRNLTNAPASDGSPSWAPDGATLVFDSDRDGGQKRLYFMDADGGNVRPFPVGPGALPRWSPDGSAIAFMSDRDGDNEIYVANVDGSDVRRLTRDPRVNGYPRWRPDGRALVHTAGAFETERWELVLTTLTGDSTRVLMDSVDSGNAAWSPDGRQLLFGRYTVNTKDGLDESRLHLLDLASGRVTRIR